MSPTKRLFMKEPLTQVQTWDKHIRQGSYISDAEFIHRVHCSRNEENRVRNTVRFNVWREKSSILDRLFSPTQLVRLTRLDSLKHR